LLYSGIGLLEATNLSVGRGTDWPFEVIGAPWIGDPAGLAEALNARGLAGVAFVPVSYTPTSSVFAGQPLGGVRFVVTDREALRTVTLGLVVARELMERYPANFRPAAIQNLLVNRSTIWALPAERAADAHLELGRRRPPELPPAPRVVPHLLSAADLMGARPRGRRPAAGPARSGLGPRSRWRGRHRSHSARRSACRSG
jgi:hypothetical protein